MNFPLRLVVGLVGSLLALRTLAAGTDIPQGDVLVVIGQLVSIEDAPNACELMETAAEEDTEYKTTCISMDNVFNARYVVLEVLSGVSMASEITFRVADHYGFPEFAKYKQALLFINVGADEAWLEKYQGYAVHRTVDGRWASCGNPYDKDRLEFVRPVRFAGDFGSAGEFSREGLIDAYRNEHIEVVGGRIICRRGIYLSDLYEIVRTGVFRSRGLDLPQLPQPDR